jgi:hypothetical protein
MAKNVIYLELSQGNASNGFLSIEAYKYGTGEQFKTHSSAIKQAQKDFKKEAIKYLKDNLNYIGTRNALRVVETVNKGLLIHNQIELNS